MIVINYILAGLIFIFSYLPFFVIYGISDFFFVLLYYVIGYRRKVVFENLRNSFPGKSDKEIKKIARKFYHNFCDILLEIAKGSTMSKTTFRKRVVFKNFELIERLYDEGKSMLAVCGHTGNWEWLGITLSFSLRQYIFCIYKPFKDNFWNIELSKKRARLGVGELLPYKQTLRVLAKNKNKNYMALLAGDQTPLKSEIGYWTNFLNQETGLYSGTEKIAKLLDNAVVFVKNDRVKRGYYEVTFILLTDKPNETAENEITEMHTKELEKQILEKPDIWLWSHRRWKHKRDKNL